MNQKAIYSNRCWIDGCFQQATVFIGDGVISGIQSGRSEESGELLDLGDSVLMPGIIDAHVHVNEPGRTHWEGFDTATRAAAAGGITSIVDMPLNAEPVTTSVESFHQKLAATNSKLHVNCGFYGGLVPGNLHELEGLLDEGVLGIKAFLTHSGIETFPNVEEQDLEAAMPILAKRGATLLVHCELTDTRHQSPLDANPHAYQNYLNSRPKNWENKAVAMMIRLCRKHLCPVHIVHVSSSEALQMIEDAKTEGLPVTAETCPQYIYFSAEDIPDNQTIYKCAPPIREKENNRLLKRALKNGVLDFIATDHSPAPPEDKEIESGNFLKAWGGIAGLQFLLPASWSALKEEMTLEQFIPLVTEHPAHFLQLPRKGYIRSGYDADLVAWNPEESFVPKEDTIFHKHKISPYVREELFGTTLQTYVNGELVFDRGATINQNKGKWLLRK